MATVTTSGGLQSTGNLTSYASSTTTTPAIGDLIVVVVYLTGSTATDWVLTDDQGGTYTKIRRQVQNASADIMEVWVRNQLVTTTAAHTLTYSHASGAASGCIFDPRVVTGMSRTGANAVRSQGGQDNQAAGGTPAPALNQAALTANPTITAVHNASSPDGLTAPTGWVAGIGRAYSTPTTGSRSTHRNSGFTGTTITWGSTSATLFSSVAVELDASAVSLAYAPRIQRNPLLRR